METIAACVYNTALIGSAMIDLRKILHLAASMPKVFSIVHLALPADS